MVTLIYRATACGPICRNIAALAPDDILVAREGDPVRTDLILRWGSSYPGYRDKTSLNTAEAVAQTNNKVRARKLLTGLCPQTWYRYQDVLGSCVIRPRRHHAAEHFFVCRDDVAIRRAILACDGNIRRTAPSNYWYATELIDKLKEYRVFVCQNRVVGVTEKFPAGPNVVAWNFGDGNHQSRIKRKEWPIPTCKLAIEAARRLSLDWCAVDIILDQAQRPLVLEANTAPGITKERRLIQVARVLASLTGASTPPPPTGDSWKDLIHPALREQRGAENEDH